MHIGLFPYVDIYLYSISIGIYTTRLVYALTIRHERYVYIYRFIYEKYIFLNIYTTWLVHVCIIHYEKCIYM